MKGKKRLCLDLSRCVNKVIKAPKFKIESTMAALQVVEQGDYMFSFDLKSAYLQIRVNENFLKYLGFAIEEGNVKRYFQYCNLPFGLNDAMRVLTKLLRSPLERWRRTGIRAFIHVDDGLGLVRGRDRAVSASLRVRKDLEKYGLLASEEKSEWGARTSIVWTGFLWDTRRFKLFVPEEKLERVEVMLEDLLKDRKESVRIRRLARVAGMIGSFSLAMGNVARFHTRGMLTQVAMVSGKAGWESSCKMDERVIREIRFWKENIRELNGWRMRNLEEVVYCKKGSVSMFSDASEIQVGGARIEGNRVCWDTVFKVSLTEEERAGSSTYRELRGIEEGLRANGRSLRGKTVRWGCDNWCAGKIVK